MILLTTLPCWGGSIEDADDPSKQREEEDKEYQSAITEKMLNAEDVKYWRGKALTVSRYVIQSARMRYIWVEIATWCKWVPAPLTQTYQLFYKWMNSKDQGERMSFRSIMVHRLRYDHKAGSTQIWRGLKLMQDVNPMPSSRVIILMTYPDPEKTFEWDRDKRRWESGVFGTVHRFHCNLVNTSRIITHW